jgi:hypothetical protein
VLGLEDVEGVRRLAAARDTDMARHLNHMSRYSELPARQFVMEIVCGHHEKWDGSGYLLGLRGEETPYSAVPRVSHVPARLDRRRFAGV